MNNVVALDSSRRAVRARLWNPPNAHASTEMDIVSGAELRKRRAEIVRQEVEAKRAQADFLRQKRLDDLLRSELAQHMATKEIARKLLAEKTDPSPPLIRHIIALVSAEYRVTPVDILSRRRTMNIVRPRWVVMYLARTLTIKSVAEIGRAVGGVDHTTVLNGIKYITRQMEESATFRAKIAVYQDLLLGRS